jgi:hypothetical protein
MPVGVMMTGVVFQRSESKGSVFTGRSSDDWHCVLKMGLFTRLGKESLTDVLVLVNYS